MARKPVTPLNAVTPTAPRFGDRLEIETGGCSKAPQRKRPTPWYQADRNLDKSCLTPSLPDDAQAQCAAALAAITRAITASLDVATSFAVVAQQAQHILAHDVLVVLLPQAALDPASNPVEDDTWGIAFCYPAAIATTDVVLPLTAFSFRPALLADQTVVIADFATLAAQYAGDRVILDNFGCAAVIAPIQTAHFLGGLAFISRTPQLYQRAAHLPVESIAGLLAVALEHQRLDHQGRTLAVAEERNRLAREIHDTLAHSLTGIIINLEALKPYATGRSQADAEVLTETEGLARGALAEARRSVLGLHPTPLQHQSLREALTQELAGLAKRAGLVTQLYVHGVERPLAPDLASALFRVAQEAFHNIDKHAAARHVILGMDFAADDITLTVEDDGIGFVATAAVPHTTGGFGLLSMATRAQSLGGQLHITSQPGHGTTVQATIPYHRPSRAVPALPKSDNAVPPAPTACPIRVLIVDNHTTARQGIRRILDGHPDIQVVGEAADGLVAIEQTAQLHPDVVLLDLQMPRLAGLETLPRLRATHPTVEVIVLTMFDQDEQLFASLKAGARGYVLKDAAPDTIVAAVRAASHGESALSPTLATRVVERFTALAQREVDPDALTARELELLTYMAQGLPYKAIAAQLHVTTHTVQYHVTNILQKLHVGNRSEAVAVAGQWGLLKQVK